jgi:hypothetical protein
MQIQIRQGLTMHYEVPQGLPHEMLVLLLQLNEQPEDESLGRGDIPSSR